MRIAIYGNLMLDTILTIDGPLVEGAPHNCFSKSIPGGIANFVRAGVDNFDITIVSKVGNDFNGDYLISALEHFDLYIPKIPTEKTTTATVIVNKGQATRTGFVDWGACSKVPISVIKNKVDVSHIMYIDRIQITPDNIRSMSGIKTCDFCDADEAFKYRYLLEHVDYAIMSDTNNKDKLLDIPINFIFHSPNKILYRIDGAVGEYNIDPLPNLNVCGAGDYFAANAIANIMKNKKLDCEFVHQQTLDLIKRQSR